MKQERAKQRDSIEKVENLKLKEGWDFETSKPSTSHF